VLTLASRADKLAAPKLRCATAGCATTSDLLALAVWARALCLLLVPVLLLLVALFVTVGFVGTVGHAATVGCATTG